MKKVLFYVFMFQLLASGALTAAIKKNNSPRASAAEVAINRLESSLNKRAASFDGYTTHQLKENGVLSKKEINPDALMTAHKIASMAADEMRKAAKSIANTLRDSLAKKAPETEMVQ